VDGTTDDQEPLASDDRHNPRAAQQEQVVQRSAVQCSAHQRQGRI